ncbi:MAG: transposase [Desulfobaccales bacterium]
MRADTALISELQKPLLGDIDEERARRFFLKYRWRQGLKNCPRCAGEEVQKIRRNRLLCSDCRYEFSDFTGTCLGLLRVGLRQWLRLIMTFERDFSARQAAQKLGLSYPTVLKGFNIIRKAILSQDQDFQPIQGGMKAQAPALGGRPGDQEGVDPLNPEWIFGIRERSGQVRVGPVFNLNADVLSGLRIRSLGRTNIVYTNGYQDYDSLMFCAPGPLDGNQSLPILLKRTIIHEQQGFRGYAKKRLTRFRGISPENFFLFLKELEFRYNRKNGESFTTLATYLSRPVADLL